MYKVLDDCNVLVEIVDEDIENAVAENKVTYEIMQAMGASHREEYMKYIIPFLEGEYFYIRRQALQAVLNLNSKLGLEAVKQRCEQYSLEDEDPWNKVLFIVAVIMIEEGTEGMRKYFYSEGGDSRVKDSIGTFYRRGYQFTEADIELLCDYLESYIEKSFDWIKKMSKSDWKESVYFAFESFIYAGTETSVLSEISDELSTRICQICENAIEVKFGEDTNDAMAITSQYMRSEYAIRILRALKGKVKGSAKTEFKKSLKKWNITEEEL